MAEKKYRVAVIGCGGMGHLHGRVIYKINPRTELRSLFMDNNPDAVKKLADVFSVPKCYN